MKRKSYTNEQRAEILRQWAIDGTSADVFGHKIGIDKSSLYQWRINQKAGKIPTLASDPADPAAVTSAPATVVKTSRTFIRAKKQTPAPVLNNGNVHLHCPECGKDLVAAFNKVLMVLNAMKDLNL